MKELTLKQVLQDMPPGYYSNVKSVINQKIKSSSNKGAPLLQTPELDLYCDGDNCKGVRRFECNEFPGYYNEIVIGSSDTSFKNCYIEYLCQNCKENLKSYSLILFYENENDELVDVVKYGEFPFYGPSISPKLIKLIGPDKDVFFKGLKCENQGLGVAAFIYYRRVIESQKDRIIDSIISVLVKTRAEQNDVIRLQNAKNESQFTKAILSIKELIPKQLFIDGVNPMLLLYKALSIGVHDLTDEQCLELAHSVRVVLSELSKMISEVMKNHNEVKNAIKTLNKVPPADNASGANL